MSSDAQEAFTYEEVAKSLDHALLKPDLTQQDLEAGLDFALTYQVASVCILPHYLSRATLRLAGSGVFSSTTIAFPHGAISQKAKRYEAQCALSDGCQELDVVVNVSRVLSEDWSYVETELRAIIEDAHSQQSRVKVIFENYFLEEKHKRVLCEICSSLKADWVKTSTGFAPGGATLKDVALMRSLCPPHVQVKASGGVRSLDEVLAFRAAGASRIGTSGTQSYLDEARKRLSLAPLS